MTVFFPRPWTNEGSKQTEPVKFDWWKDFKGGFETENLPAIVYQHMSDNSDFVPEENYNPSQDPQLRGYEDFMHLFYFSKSSHETSSIIEKYKRHQDLNYASPWHYIGKIAGAALDPSSALFFTKAGNVGKIVGSAMLAEELLKQNMDPIRDDSYVPMVAAYGYTVPFLLNKLTARPNLKTQKKIKEFDEEYISKAPIKEDDIAIDGTFVNPNKTDPKPSAVGSDVTSQPIIQTAKEQMYGEKFVKSNLGIFGEDGPWTPVFRVIKQNTSLTARKMMGDLLDTPLLKLKNTKAWGFSATGKSIETDMRMMRVGEIESHKMVKDQYLKYVQRQQKETGTPVSMFGTDLELGLFKNRGKVAQSEGWLNQDQFSKEVTIARLNSFDHAIPEVAEAARATQKNVYEPLFALANELKIREIPVKQELKFWNQQLKNLRKKKEGSVTFKSKYGDPDEVYSLTRIESTIDKLTDRLNNIQKGKGVKDYINIVYVKNAIDKNKDHFRGIIERFHIRNNISMSKADLNELVYDLSNHFPFIKPRKGDYEANQRYVFKDPRYARAIKSRELHLDKQAQLELIDAGMIMSDIFALQKIYARQMIPDILLTRKYGDPNGLGYRFIDDSEMSGFNPGLMSVANEYNMKMAMGKPTNKIVSNEVKVKPVQFNDTSFNKKFSQDIKTGKPVKITAYRGITKEPFKGNINISGTKGRSWANNIEQASFYSDDIVKATLNLNKPFVIKTDKDIIKFVNGLWDNTVAIKTIQDAEIVALQTLRRDNNHLTYRWAKTQGYDSIVIDLQKKSAIFDQNEIVVFESLTKQIDSKGFRANLLKERDQVLGDLEAGIELIKGTYGLPANPHAWTSVAMRTMKHYNALTMLTGFMAAIPDVARITMTSGIKRGFKTQFGMLSDFLGDGQVFKMGKKEAQSFGEAVDMVTGQRAMLFADVGDMFGLANKFEGGMGKVSAINFMYVNLMSRWTEMAKSMASVTIGSRILEDSIAWGKGGLSDKWKTALSSSGIDKDMARRIANQFNEHGTKTKNNFMANTSQWSDKQAVDAFGAALNKDINITIVTPGLGDTPKWMSKELGSTIAQFKKFAMSATQRMLMRGMQEKDLDFLFGSMMLMGSGMLIDGIYHKYRFNRDYSKLSLTQKLLNAFDRSGLAGIYTDVNKAIETLTDNRIGISPLLGEKKPYGSSTRWKMGTVFGASGGQIYNIFDIMFDVGGNKYNHHTAKNVRRLIPFQNVWYLDWLFDDIQKGLRFK